MAGTYIRCDVDCKPVAKQPANAQVKQDVSCITYEVWNGDYKRSRTPFDEPFPALKQPALKSGWNGDYIQTQSDGTQKTGIAQQQVTQSLYIKSDVDCALAPYECYVRSSLFNLEIPDVIDPVETPVVLALAADRDNIFVTENNIFRIVLENNTVLK